VPELRVDALSGRWSLVAPERAARPYTTAAITPPAAGIPADGPGCPRVVPNLYPAVGGTDAGPDAGGVHEVVIFSPEHDRALAQLDDDQAVEAFVVLRDRARVHYDAGHTFVQAIVNHGRAAGASIEHPHAQVFAIDVVPPLVTARIERFASAGEDLVTAELASAMRDSLAVVTGPAIVWCPHASTFPYQLRIAHRSTRARFDDAADNEIAVVALATRDALARLRAAIGDVAYNVVIHTAPVGPAPFFHWWVDVRPRLTVTAGFEEGTGIYINTVVPDRAADALRSAEP
jgi:UDPglucose--hexose-1-phosphate uridylyltransferase